MLRGGPGDDVLNGGYGIDVLDGGPGEDTLVGGLGNNSFIDGDFIKGWIASVDEKPELVISDLDTTLAKQDLSGIVCGDG